MNYQQAGELKQRARERGICADRVGLPPRPGESLNRNPSCSVVFWLSGRDFEFSDIEQAENWLNRLRAV